MNPAFAIAELVWIMAGRDDAAFVNFFNPALPRYAGGSARYHGAYGYRLRHAFGLDQLVRAKTALEGNRESRQVVLQLWGPHLDLPLEDGSPASPDVPCNVVSMLKVRDGRLEWTQVLRSNDVFLGLPFNFVQFTSLQEVMAGWLKLDVGQYTHISDSLHIYERDLSTLEFRTPVRAESNVDNLALPFQDSISAWSTLERLTERLVAPSLTSSDLEQLLVKATLALPFRNCLAILAADTARRRGWHDLMNLAAASCLNPAFIQLWHCWLARTLQVSKT